MIDLSRGRTVHLLCAALLLVSLACFGAVAEAGNTPNVVIINSYHQGYVWSDAETAGILESLRKKYPKLYPTIENLDAKRFPGAQHASKFKDYLVKKYHSRRIDLVMVLDNPALDMIMAYRSTLFRDAPVIFCGINDFRHGQIPGRTEATGIAEIMDFEGTLKMILSIHPGIKEVVVIHDQTGSGLATRREMDALVPKFSNKIAITYLPPMSFDNLVTKLKKLPQNTAALILTFTTDISGKSLPLSESTRKISDSAPVPVYAAHETRLGHGIVGGSLLSGTEHGAKAGEYRPTGAGRRERIKDTDRCGRRFTHHVRSCTAFPF